MFRCHGVVCSPLVELQVWLGVGAAVGLTIGYKLATSRPVKTGIAGLHLKYWAVRRRV